MTDAEIEAIFSNTEIFDQLAEFHRKRIENIFGPPAKLRIWFKETYQMHGNGD